MAYGSGLSATFSVATEATPGVPVAVTRSFEMDSETLSLKRNIAQGTGLRGGNLYERSARRQLVTVEAAGDVNLDVPTANLGILLQHMLGSWSATATQVGTTTAYQQVHNPGSNTGKSLTIQVVRPTTQGVLEPFTYPQAKVTSWEIDCKANDKATMKLSFDAAQELTSDAGGVCALQAANYVNSQAFMFSGAKLYKASALTQVSGVFTPTTPTALATVNDFSIKGDNPLATSRFYAGSQFKAEQIENNYRAVTGSATLDFASRADLYNSYAADGGLVLQISLVGPTIPGAGTPASLTITLPSVRLEDGLTPNVSGPAILTTKAAFTALSDDTNGAIQVVYVSGDTVV